MLAVFDVRKRALRVPARFGEAYGGLTELVPFEADAFAELLRHGKARQYKLHPLAIRHELLRLRSACNAEFGIFTIVHYKIVFRVTVRVVIERVGAVRNVASARNIVRTPV